MAETNENPTDCDGGEVLDDVALKKPDAISAEPFMKLAEQLGRLVGEELARRQGELMRQHRT
jgi:hypothetical protein